MRWKKLLVKIIIVSYGTPPLVLAFNFDFLSPVEPVKIVPRISSRKKISLSNLENGPKTKHHRKDLKTKSCKIFVLNHPKETSLRHPLCLPPLFPFHLEFFPRPFFSGKALPFDLQLHQLAKSTWYRRRRETGKKKRWKNPGTNFAERYR